MRSNQRKSKKMFDVYQNDHDRSLRVIVTHKAPLPDKVNALGAWERVKTNFTQVNDDWAEEVRKNGHRLYRAGGAQFTESEFAARR
jgi:hypothetical protein